MRASLLVLPLLVACGGKDSADPTGPGPLPTGDDPLQYTPVTQWGEYRFEDIKVREYIPENPRGVLIFFHGTNTGVTAVKRIEVIAFLNELILADIGFVATESTDRATGKWDDIDVPRVGRLYEHVVENTALDPDDALFAAGFSGGGRMTGMFAEYALEQGFPITAANPNQSGCAQCIEEIPTIFVLSENDTDPHQMAQSRHEALKAAGTPTELLMVNEKVIVDDSFTKHPQMNPERSAQVLVDLIDKEMVDADGVRIVPDAEAEQWCQWYETNGGSYVPSNRADELRVLWALHRFSGEYSREVRNFFLDQM